MGLRKEQDQGERSSEYQLVTIQEDLEQLEKLVPVKVLYGWLSQQHEHFYENLEEMEEDLREILKGGGTIIVGVNLSGELVSFVSCRSVEREGARFLVVNNLTSTAGSVLVLKEMGRMILENHADCDYIAHSIRPDGSPHDQKLARFYLKVGFQPDERWASSDSERVPVSMPMDNFRKIVERR